MKREHLFQLAATWAGDTWAGRIDQCASMLFVHGFIPMSMRAKIGAKLERECEQAARDNGSDRNGEDAPSAASGEASQSGRCEDSGIAQPSPGAPS